MSDQPAVPPALGAGVEQRPPGPGAVAADGGHRPDPRQRPAAELVRDLSTQVSTLVRQELELAKVELAEKGKRAGVGAGLFSGAGLFGLYGVGALTAGAILLLSRTSIVPWLCAVIVAVALLVLAGILALAGWIVARRAIPAAPQQAVESLKEDVRFTKEHVQEARHHHHEAGA